MIFRIINLPYKFCHEHYIVPFRVNSFKCIVFRKMLKSVEENLGIRHIFRVSFQREKILWEWILIRHDRTIRKTTSRLNLDSKLWSNLKNEANGRDFTVGCKVLKRNGLRKISKNVNHSDRVRSPKCGLLLQVSLTFNL